MFSHSAVSDSLRPYGLQHARLTCPLPSPGVCSNLCPLSWGNPYIYTEVIHSCVCFLHCTMILSRGFVNIQRIDSQGLYYYTSLGLLSGEGNGNPVQCSCLENPMDGGAWWAAVYGVAQSWTRLKRLSSSSSRAAIGEGNATPLQYPCLDNPMDGGAW